MLRYAENKKAITLIESFLEKYDTNLKTLKLFIMILVTFIRKLRTMLLIQLKLKACISGKKLIIGLL